jgi:hypothetical protein
MRVRAIAKYVPSVGRRGEEKEIDGPSARVLVLLGKVEIVEGTPKKKATTKRRAYKRRDMVPEAAPAPAPEPEILDESDDEASS